MTTDGVLERIIPDLERATASYVRERALAGAAVGLVVDDHLAWSHGVGLADQATGRAMNARTVVRIGSISKTFTATLVLGLRDRGLLELDDAAVRYIPELAGADDPFGRIEQLTIRRLLTHTSGLDAQLAVPGAAADTDDRWPLLSTATALAFPDRIRVVDPPGSSWRYSGLAYRLLGVAIERLSGRPFWDVLRSEILDPLGMRSTAPEPVGELAERRAVGYEAILEDRRHVPATVMDSRWFIGSGELWSTVEDMARWASAQLVPYGAPPVGPEITAPATLLELHRQTVLIDDAWTESWGLGWAGTRRGDRVTVGHSGSLPGFVSGLDLCLRERVGAISLFNGEPGMGPSLNERLLDFALPVLAR